MQTVQTMTGKVVLITGATGGIGKESARQLAAQGAKVVIVGRSEERALSAVADIVGSTRNPHVTYLLADLSSQAEVRRLAGQVLSSHDRLDVLINNIGGIYPQRKVTADGIEATLAVNHLNVLLLTQLLLPLLKASTPSRIINLTSSSHRFAGIRWNNIQGETWYRAMDIYAQAKLMHLVTTYELARRLEGTGITVHVADPGSTMTDMTRDLTPAMFPWYVRPIWPFVRRKQRGTSTARAADSTVYLATTPQAADLHGAYLNARSKVARSSIQSYDEDLADRLWQYSLRMVGLRPETAASAAIAAQQAKPETAPAMEPPVQPQLAGENVPAVI